MIVLIKTLQVILALSILILVHEFGHFFFAKLFGIRVDKFYLFFDAGGFKLFSKKIGDTEYGVGWLPLGGYCKIAGMIDESLDTDQMKNEPQPWEFRTKSAWQRLLVMAGGVMMNFILAIFIYIGIIISSPISLFFFPSFSHTKSTSITSLLESPIYTFSALRCLPSLFNKSFILLT